MSKDDWLPPFDIKIINNFVDDSFFKTMNNLINTRVFYSATQGVNNRQVIQEQHKIRKDYTLTMKECSLVDELVLKAKCNCNLRERWRLLYYDGDADKKAFRDAHTDWTSFSCHRRMSIIIGLSNPSDYEGGELVFPKNNLTYKLDKGSAVIFNGRLLHEVLPVTKGKRYVLQAFLFDKSGWDIKKVQNGYDNFELKINETGTINKFMTDNWKIYYNKNMIHSKIDSYNTNFLGTFNSLHNIQTILKETDNVDFFTWHKPQHPNKKWRGRLYGWSDSYCRSKNRENISTWSNEHNTVSGKKITDIKDNISKNKDNLTLLTCDGGPGNQIVGIKEGIILSKYLNKEFLFPPIIQHYTLNINFRGSSENIKYWKFSDIFNYKNINKELLDQLDLFDNSNSTIYCTRSVDIDKHLRIENVLNIKCRKKQLSQKNFKNKGDIMNLAQYNDTTLAISHLYNNVNISECGWNGCDICPINQHFIKDYREICKNFDFSVFIKTIGDKYILENFNNDKFISIHIRYQDYGNINIKEVNKLYDETDIKKFIIELCNEYNISDKNIFIATNKQQRVINSELKTSKMLQTNKYYNELESFIEQYICSMSYKFLYTGGVHAKPEHSHLRSTWSSFVLDYRYCVLNKSKNDNYYLNNYFSKNCDYFGYNY